MMDESERQRLEALYDVHLSATVPAGADIGDVARSACRLAKQYNVEMRYEFNGTPLVAAPGDSYLEVKARYYQSLQERDAKMGDVVKTVADTPKIPRTVQYVASAAIEINEMLRQGWRVVPPLVAAGSGGSPWGVGPLFVYALMEQVQDIE